MFLALISHLRSYVKNLLFLKKDLNNLSDEGKLSKIIKHPIVLQRLKDNAEQFLRSRDDRFSTPSTRFNPIMVSSPDALENSNDLWQPRVYQGCG